MTVYKTDVGFLNHSLAFFDTKDFANGTAPTKVYIFLYTSYTLDFRNVTTLRPCIFLGSK